MTICENERMWTYDTYSVGTAQKFEWTRNLTIFTVITLMFFPLLWKNKHFFTVTTVQITMSVKMHLKCRYCLIR